MSNFTIAEIFFANIDNNFKKYSKKLKNYLLSTSKLIIITKNGYIIKNARFAE